MRRVNRPPSPTKIKGKQMIGKFTKEEIESVWGEPLAGNVQSIYGKINELVDTINTIQKEREAEWFEIREWIGILEAVRESVNVHEKQIDELQMKAEPHKCEPAENATISKMEKDHRPNMVMDDPFGPHPNIYEQSMRMDKEFAEDECVRLQNELDRTRGALNIAIKTLKFIEHQGNCTDVEDEAFDCLQMIKSLGVEL